VIAKEATSEIREKSGTSCMSEWDPIGVREMPEASDEYDLYLGDVYALVVGNADPLKLAEYLRWVEVERMELVDERGKPLLAEEVRNSVAASLASLQPK
jgi:hypothetical protein